MSQAGSRKHFNVSLTRQEVITLSFDKILARLSNRIITNENGCWLWTGPLFNNGYARITLKVYGSLLGHKLLYEKKYNCKLGHYTDLHHNVTCQRHCINPEHVKAISKSEHRRIHNAKLTPEQRIQIKELYMQGKPVTELKIMFNVTVSTLLKSLRRDHVQIRGRHNRNVKDTTEKNSNNAVV